MARMHGSWGHYVRPGISDPVYNRSWWRRNEDDAEPTYSKSNVKKRKKKRVKSKTPSISSFVVYSVDGKVLYQCGKKKAPKAKSRIVKLLPAGSYTWSGNTIRLNWGLSSLGFKSAAEFTKCCAGTQDKQVEKRSADIAAPWHLSKDEVRTLDRTYRLHGGDPDWKGWDTVIRGRSKSLLFSEVRRLGIDKPDDKSWTKVEIKVFHDHWRTLLPDSSQWKKLLPRKSPEGIAYAYLQQGHSPQKPEAREHTGTTKRYVRKKKWHRVEDDALRRQFAIGETSMYQIKQVIPYRANADIRLRIVELGLADPNGKTNDENRSAERATKRNAWAVEMVEAYYEVYGKGWSQWRRILPWMEAEDIAALARSIGSDDPWSDEDREYFLENEGADWTLEELNELIRLAPLLGDDDRETWSSFLPGIEHEDRSEMLELLDIPTKDEVDELAHMAAELK